MPTDRPAGSEQATARLRVSLDEQETHALLEQAPGEFGAEVEEALLAALAQAFSRWTGEGRLLVDVEGTGRDLLAPGADLSRAVGRFGSIFPLYLEVASEEPAESLRAVRSQVQAVPGRGAGYALLRHRCGEEIRARLDELPRAEVSFNYSAQAPKMTEEALLDRIDEPLGQPAWLAAHPLEVHARLVEDRLELWWAYRTDRYEEQTVGRLARWCVQALRDLIASGQASPEERLSPTDFPTARLGQADFDRLLAQLT
jgi:non-ribosomal peptide synthase protein (TIGR01720 family)